MHFPLWILVFAIIGALPSCAAAAQEIEIPAWFSDTFLDFREDVRDAARSGKRLMIYFGQDGCPYCKELMVTNFSQKQIEDKARKHLLAVALNIWGDRETVWIDGEKRSEKDLARFLKVQFTPTLLFLDESGQVVVRLNGYYPPHRFDAALEYVAGRQEKRQPFDAYMRAAVKEAASATLREQPFFLKPPYDLRRRRGARPLAVLFETKYCAACDELHREGFPRADVRALLGRFDVVRLSLSERAEVVTPDGYRTSGEGWARSLKIGYAPSIVFFDGAGREVFRIEAYLRPFHFASSLEYVAGGAYKTEPSFQRFVQARAERLRARGEPVELWR